jgi:hypothetical protein
MPIMPQRHLACNKCGRDIGEHSVSRTTGFKCPGKPHIKVGYTKFLGRCYVMYADRTCYRPIAVSNMLEGLK